MDSAFPEIISCPLNRRVEALSLVLCDIAPSQRQDIAATFPETSPGDVELAGGGLFVAMRGQQLCGAAWGQRQPGNTAVFWPPQLIPGETQQTADQLANTVAAERDRGRVAMTQVLLPPGDVDHVDVISSAGFRHLADLLYLSWEAGQNAAQPDKDRVLDFLPFDP